MFEMVIVICAMWPAGIDGLSTAPRCMTHESDPIFRAYEFCMAEADYLATKHANEIIRAMSGHLKDLKAVGRPIVYIDVSQCMEVPRPSHGEEKTL